MPNVYNTDKAAAEETRRRLYIYNGGFLTQSRLRRILHLSGYDIKIGKPGKSDMIGVWGKSPTSPRGEAISARTNAPILRVEDAFLRSVHPGRSNGEPPLGLFLDTGGVHFDPATVTDLETLLAKHPLDDTALLNRARTAMDRLKNLHLSKYNSFDPDLPAPPAGYVLVIDQTEKDASVTSSNADRARFQEMLVFAQEENPGARILIKTHPETNAGTRAGYYSVADTNDRISLCDAPISPWHLLAGAVAVYTVSSQLGFEAILAGHKPRIFGQPFYAGWGLTSDEMPLARRQRNLTRAQLFAAAMILYPKWYDPYRDCLCEIETVIDTLEAQTRAYRQDKNGYIALGMRLWKRAPLQEFYGQIKKIKFINDPVKAHDRVKNRSIMVWSSKESCAPKDTPLLRVEDGFLRSRGLGATLNAPLSLVTDDLGIYYDPSRPSRLEQLINAAPNLPQHAINRAERLLNAVIRGKLSKYNIGTPTLPDLPKGYRILVPGQVEDDASIQKGCSNICTNLDLLKRTRAENPDAVILFKPHPDVEAGLRQGIISRNNAELYADLILDKTDPVALINEIDAVWTLTSLLGFEALIRGKSVTCLGMPFYGGWGLTTDLVHAPSRRTARPSLLGLGHATLIEYPRYFDPITKSPCPPEVVVERLQSPLPNARPATRALAKLQGVFASYAYLWR